MRGLESRIARLEQVADSGRAVWVQRYRSDGSLVPIPRGCTLADHYALLPEVCATVEEWIAQLHPELRQA